MSKAERLTRRVDELEREYRAVLRKALSDCAAGRWGLFGQNEPNGVDLSPPELAHLRQLARTIDQLRGWMSIAPFELHQQFEAARGRAGPNASGEPKQAEAWLRQIEEH